MKAGLIIVIVALMGAILAGSISFTHTTYPDIGYDKVSDLTPIVTADPVLSDEIYNPTSNQTGWSNVTYTIQVSPSVYSFRNAGTFGTFNTAAFSSYGGISYTTASAWSNGTYTPDGYTNVQIGLTWSDGSNGAYADGGRIIIGGYYDKSPVLRDNLGYDNYSECNVYWQYHTLGATKHYATSDTPIYWQSLTRVADSNNWPSGVIVDGDTPYIVFGNRWLESESMDGMGFTSSNDGHVLTTELYITVSTSTGIKYYWDAERVHFYPITGYDDVTGAPLYDTNYASYPVWLIADGSSTSATLTLNRYIAGTITYVTPYTAVDITPGQTATWSNGYNNTRVQLIVDPQSTIVAGGQTLSLPTMSTVYDKCLVTLGSDNCYWQGITEYNTPTNYTLFDYQYPFGVTVTTPITSLSVSASTMAYIVNTWVPTDPRGLLWQDPEFNINTYFPTVASSGARVIFSSVLTTGDSITINGNDYNTYNGTVEINGNTYRLNGLCVDFRTDGNVYVVTASGTTIDLGPRSTYEISADGVWYWAAELDDIHTVYRERTEILTAQAPDPNWMVFAFIGISIICLVAMAAIGRESMDGFDWIIVILSIIISLMLVV